MVITNVLVNISRYIIRGRSEICDHILFPESGGFDYIMRSFAGVNLGIIRFFIGGDIVFSRLIIILYPRIVRFVFCVCIYRIFASRRSLTSYFFSITEHWYGSRRRSFHFV